LADRCFAQPAFTFFGDHATGVLCLRFAAMIVPNVVLLSTKVTETGLKYLGEQFRCHECLNSIFSTTKDVSVTAARCGRLCV
jgi:hypothetical protein